MLQVLPGTFIENERHYTIATNRTGGALVAGDVVAIDLTKTDADTPAYATDPTGIFNNVIAVATAHLTGWILCVCEESVADNASGKFTIVGKTGVLVGTGTTAGMKLKGVNAAKALVARTDGTVGVALLLVANASGADAVRDCIFNGYGNWFNASGAA